MNKGISVVICSYNSESRINGVLDCLNAQKDTEDIAWEVIMVDNASKDNTVSVAKKSWNNSTVPLRIYHEANQGQSYATRTGFKKANYDIIVMVDDDNYVSSNYIKQAYTIMKTHPEVGIAGGKGIGLFEKEPPAWFKSIEQAFAIGPQGENEGYVPDKRGYIYGAGSIIRKPVYDFALANGFKLMLKGRIGKSMVAGEDTERSHVFRILGYKLWYNPSLEFKHYMPAGRINWDYIRRLYRSFGRAYNYHKLYHDILLNKKGIRVIASKNIITSVILKILKLLTTLPPYIMILIIGPTEGKREVLNFEYHYGSLLERIANNRRIKRYRRRLKDAEWRKHIRPV